MLSAYTDSDNNFKCVEVPNLIGNWLYLYHIIILYIILYLHTTTIVIASLIFLLKCIKKWVHCITASLRFKAKYKEKLSKGPTTFNPSHCQLYT